MVAFTMPAGARRGLIPDLVSGATARALDEGAPPLDPVRGEIHKNKDLVEARAQDEIQRHAKFRELRGFYVDYSTLRCVAAPKVATDRPYGACVVTAHAFQVIGEVALTVSSSGIGVHALSTTVD